MPLTRTNLLVQVLDDRVRLAGARLGPWSARLCGLAEVAAPVREGGAELSNRLVKELEEFLPRIGHRPARTVVSLPRALLIWRYFRVPPVPADDLERLIGFELDKHLPVKSEEAYVRWLPAGKDDEGWTILLAATRRDFVRPVEEALEMLGLRPAWLVPELGGLFSLLDRLGRKPGGGRTAVAAVLPDTVETAVLDDGVPVLWRRDPLPLREEGGSEELAVRAQAAAVAIEGALREPAGDGGTGAERGFLWDETGTADPVLQRLSAGTVAGWQTFRLEDVPAAAGAAPLLGKPRGAACLGLALDPGDAVPLGVDLLPKPPARARRRPGGRTTAALAVLLLGAMAFYGATLDRERQGRLARLRGEISRLKTRVEAIKTLADDLKWQEGRLAALGGGVNGRVLTVDLLKELTEAIPADAYLSQVTRKKQTLELTGFASAASDLIPRLEASPRFKNVAFDAPITSQGQQKERFKIKLTLE